MTKNYDLAIIGLGIVGASAVYAATRAGASVLALDAGIPGAGTSGTSFAWLNSCRKEPEHYYRLNVDGMIAHEELARELGGDAGHHAGGSLEWADPGPGERELRGRAARLRGAVDADISGAARRQHPGRPRRRSPRGDVSSRPGAPARRACARHSCQARRQRRTAARHRGDRRARPEIGSVRVPEAR